MLFSLRTCDTGPKTILCFFIEFIINLILIIFKYEFFKIDIKVSFEYSAFTNGDAPSAYTNQSMLLYICLYFIYFKKLIFV